MPRRILFNFGYYRKGWIAPIESLGPEIEVVYIFYTSPDQELEKFTSHRVIYWDDFTSAQHLLDEIAPERIVFMSIDSIYSITLNFVAHKRGIETFILQHGVYSTYKEYRQRDKRTKKIEEKKQTIPVVRTNAFGFFKASLKLKDVFSFIKFPFYLFAKRSQGVFYANYWFTFNAKKPSYYISYTPHTARYFEETERPEKDQLLFIGNPDMDPFFAPVPPNPFTGKYYLLIDQAMADNRYGQVIYTIQQAINFYLKLNAFCLSKGARMKVKLHPESYHSNWLPRHENIDWIKDGDLPALIHHAEGCFGYFSSLIVPALYFNRCVLFKVVNHDLVTDAQTWGLAQLLDYNTFTFDEIDFSGVSKHGVGAFVNRYLHFKTGNSFDRLGDILMH